MPSTLTLGDYLNGLDRATAQLAADAAAAGLDAAVPTCPGWTVRDLVVHVGMAHRWAAAILSGVPVDEAGDEAAIAAEAQAAADLFGWLADGSAHLRSLIEGSAQDLRVFFFLKDAPPARVAWARRQCHETAIHAVDARAARLGRAVDLADEGVAPELAADGVDELLTGFVPRKSSMLRSPTPISVLVEATDLERSWLLQVGPDPVVTTPGGAVAHGSRPPGIPDVHLQGSARELYLGLWNRGQLSGRGADAFVAQWREEQRVRW
jgi:uncharacterized protein (TIGR03083 family)